MLFMNKKTRLEQRLLQKASKVYGKNIKHDMFNFISNILFI